MKTMRIAEINWRHSIDKVNTFGDTKARKNRNKLEVKWRQNADVKT